jgi:hypothetical protein
MYALDTRYDTGAADPHPLAGRWVPNLPLTTTTTTAATAAELLRPARGILLDLTAARTFAAAGHGWEDRVDILTAQSPGPPAPALLIRPDGYVAWAAAQDPLHAGGLRRALTTWFGAPAGG